MTNKITGKMIPSMSKDNLTWSIAPRIRNASFFSLSRRLAEAGVRSLSFSRNGAASPGSRGRFSRLVLFPARLLQQIEDHIDIEDAKKALAEPGENISAQEFWRQLGLE